MKFNGICPCGSTAFYKKCCHIIHLDITKAITAQQLMQSRYTAFTLAMGNYLMESHHTSTRPVSEKKDIVNWAKSVKWEKLEILSTTKGLQSDTEGTVEFKAFFHDKAVLECIHENSTFVKEDGHWVYLGQKLKTIPVLK